MSDKKQATSDKTSDYLLPCPFCGGEAKLQNLYRKRGWYVFCKNLRCGCRTPFYQHPFMHEDKLKALATTTWNTRKPVDAVLEHLEEEKQNALKLWDNNSRYMGYEHSIKIVKENLT